MKELPVNVWIANNGDKPVCVHGDADVKVKFRNGDVSTDSLDCWIFRINGEEDDILEFMILDPKDLIVEESEKLGLYDSATLTTVINKMRKREQVGRGKYGADVDRKDFTAKEWANHALEEAMDFVLYMQRLIDEMPDAE